MSEEDKQPKGVNQEDIETDESESESASEVTDESQETPESLKELLEAALSEAEKHRESWLRAKAESENIRKRAEMDVAGAHKYALERFSTDLLVVKDSLEAALQSDGSSADTLRDGVELTLKQLSKVFDSFGIKEINPEGEILDPHKHQAMSTVDSDAETNTVVSVFQKGYTLNDRLIRPAMVSVAKNKN